MSSPEADAGLQPSHCLPAGCEQDLSDDDQESDLPVVFHPNDVAQFGQRPLNGKFRSETPKNCQTDQPQGMSTDSIGVGECLVLHIS